MPAAKKTTKSTTASAKKFDGFSDEERAAMKEHAAELKASARRGSKADKAAEEEAAVVDKIAEFSPADRAMAERVHAIVKATAPDLAPKLWYGQPAYAKDGKIVCFFQPADKFKTRYSTLGFNDAAALDDGTMWPTAFALTKLTKTDEKRIAELVKKAAS